ncbi:hypothetical protein LTR36_001511 [Oleoguttula mirabilis]|uniref:GP-PDE domain-containing protein n=1 Tax=Oleoguttula mirabilis TaxID=1507867 RepID=A0AAV9JNR6_9PEZI|nr:hypothetical protein LTR36_001511 [Oleoguttula mirabilis]
MASTLAERQPLLGHVPSALYVPPMLIQTVKKLNSPVTMSEDTVFPPPTFTQHRLDARKRRLPQCIAHRGYKAKFPENTIAAHKGAVEAGAHGLETDVHLTKDDVVVISHDATLKRCFGRPEKIIDCTWGQIEDARTLQEPHLPMPRLKDVLEYLAQPGLEEIWLLLDIKLDNDADTVMRLIGSTLAEVSAPARKAWTERIVLGIWAAKYLPLAQKYLPGYPVMHIGFSTSYARHFFTVPHVGFNMLFPTLVAPGGKRFMREAREHGRQVLAWTVNKEDRMEWCIRRELDGVLTDDPKHFLEVCEKFDEQTPEAMMPMTLKGYFEAFRIWIWVMIALLFFGKRFKPVASRELISMKAPA